MAKTIKSNISGKTIQSYDAQASNGVTIYFTDGTEVFIGCGNYRNQDEIDADRLQNPNKRVPKHKFI